MTTDEITEACIEGKWSVPMSMLLPLLYWIFFTSVLCYALMTWGNKFTDASIISLYTVF